MTEINIEDLNDAIDCVHELLIAGKPAVDAISAASVEYGLCS